MIISKQKGDETNASSPQVKLNAKIILQALRPPLFLFECYLLQLVAPLL